MISIFIVVPTLNSYHLLPRLVKTLRDQTFTNWRVLFIDGNSSREHKDWLVQQCSEDQRFCWENETNPGKGIFAAMNQGFLQARKDDWVLFWGSDDIVAEVGIFKQINATITAMHNKPDLYICSARYYSMKQLLENGSLVPNRFSRFRFSQSLRHSLFWGSTPPHQATFFGPGAREQLDRYDERFRLTGDLDYFLRLSSRRSLRIFVDPSVLVLMGDSGASATQDQKKYKEVVQSYRKSFGWIWIIAFVSRYFQRLVSVIQKK